MNNKNYAVGPATCRLRRSNALPPHMRERTREVCCLRVPAAEQGKGYATTLMHTVCRKADAEALVLILWPQPFGDIALSAAQLESWYAREFGFQRLQADPVLLARMPGATPRQLALKPVARAANTECAA